MVIVCDVSLIIVIPQLVALSEVASVNVRTTDVTRQPLSYNIT